MNAVMGKCRNFLFHMLFLGIYGLGCLAGVLLFRFGYDAHPQWMCAYGEAVLRSPACLWGLIFTALRPFLLLLLLIAGPYSRRILPFLVGVRGACNSYAVCMCFVSEVPMTGCILYFVLLLPAYFLLCRWIYLGTPRYHGTALKQ